MNLNKLLIENYYKNIQEAAPPRRKPPFGNGYPVSPLIPPNHPFDNGFPINNDPTNQPDEPNPDNVEGIDDNVMYPPFPSSIPGGPSQTTPYGPQGNPNAPTNIGPFYAPNQNSPYQVWQWVPASYGNEGSWILWRLRLAPDGEWQYGMVNIGTSFTQPPHGQWIWHPTLLRYIKWNRNWNGIWTSPPPDIDINTIDRYDRIPMPGYLGIENARDRYPPNNQSHD